MKVAIVAPEDLPIPPRQGGSVQIYLHALCRSFRTNKLLEMTLFSPGTNAALGGVRHVSVHGPKPEYRRRVVRHLVQFKPEVVQIDNRPDFVPLIQSALPKAKIILNLHSTTFLGPMHIARSRARHILQTTTVVVNSQFLKRSITSRFHLPNASNIHVIYPGVNTIAFQAHKRIPVSSSPLRVVYVGRVIRQKGVHQIVHAVRALAHSGERIRLTIVGRTPPWERAYGLALRRATRGLPIRWLGFVSPNRLPAILSQSHVLVCPSQHSEAFGMVNVEAMAAGLAVIASRVGGIPEIVNDSCGILVSSVSGASAFADSIRLLARDRSRLHALQGGAKRRALDFTWERAARQFAEMYSR